MVTQAGTVASPFSFLVAHMTLPEIAVTLERLGCPAGKSAQMASQLDRRAKMDAGRNGISYEVALARLIGLMAQGWAASGSATKPPE